MVQSSSSSSLDLPSPAGGGSQAPGLRLAVCVPDASDPPHALSITATTECSNLTQESTKNEHAQRNSYSTVLIYSTYVLEPLYIFWIANKQATRSAHQPGLKRKARAVLIHNGWATLAGVINAAAGMRSCCGIGACRLS